MYTQISDEMKKMLEADARTFLMKLQSDTFEITSGFRKIVYQGGSSGEGLAIGTTVSASMEITMEKTEHLLTGKEFAFYLGMNVDGEEEYIPMGIFKAQKPAATDWEITLKAYDRMYDAERNYTSSLHYPTDTQKVMREIEKLLGISFVTEITPVSLKKTGDSDIPFAGYTIREAIGYVAGLYGKFAIFNRAGQLEFRWYESGMEIPLKKMFSFERNEQDYEVQKVVGSSDSNTSYTAGSGNHGISYSNPFLTQEIVNQIYSSKHGFSYRGGTVTFLGDCRIDPWDMLQCSDLQGNVYKIPAMQITHEIDGGLTTTITAEAEEEDVEDSFSGPATKAMERTFAELLLVNKLVATKASIEYLEANYIKADELDVVQANIEAAVITNLQAKFVTAEYLTANYATIGNLSAANAKIDTLEATALTASSAEIVALKTGIADINTLMFGSASGGSLSTEFSNTVVGLIGDAQIKSAMIESIDASKITALDINTTNVKVHSEDGKSQWKDNTIQIFDNQRVRVQIGKDANADYNMYVWDKSGNLMFDAIGLTEKGINRPVIRNDMVKDDANISASKLDISSLFSVINNDGSHTLKSSKIFVDADNQTLDISFKTITTKAESALDKAQDVENRANSGEFKGDKGDKGDTGATGAAGLKALQPTHNWHGTFTTVGATANCVTTDFNRTPVVGDTFSNLDGSSNTGSWKVTVVSGNSVTIQLLSYVSSKGAKGDTGATGATGKGLKSVTPQYYLSTSQTTQSGGSWSDTKSTWVTGRYYWTRDKMDWTDGSTTYSTPQLATDLNNLYSSMRTVTDTVKTQGMDISALKENISSKIWQQDITTAVTSLQIGGRNLLKGTKDFSKGVNTLSGSFDLSNTVGTYKVLKAMCPSGRTFYDPFDQGIAFEAKTTYTLSFYAKADSPCTIFSYFYDIGNAGSYYDGYKSTTLTTYWKHYIITWTTGDTARTASVLPMRLQATKNVWAYMYGIKFEKGNKATDWTPAPEDIDSSISTVEGKVTTVSNQYTSLNQSLTSLTATVNSNTTKINSKADGSTVTALQSNMTALTADLNGFKTTVSSTYSTKTEFNNLQVGGRNLLTKTNQGKTYWSFNKQNGTVSIESYETIGVKINCTVASTGYAVILYAFEQKQVNLLEPNMEYVLSFDLISSNTVAASVRICQPDATDMLANAVAFHVDAGTKWVHKSVTLRTNALTLDKSNQFVYINGFNKVGTVCFKNLKLEKGNKATDWTPAPEDVDSSIKSVATIANQTADKFQWIVKSGTSATDFTITDRMASLTAQYINLNGLVTFSGLNSSVQTTLNTASRSYSFTGANGSVKWVRLGTLTSAGDSSIFCINVQSGNGYNSGAYQNSSLDITIKDGWQGTQAAAASFGVSVIRHNCIDTVVVQVRATAHNVCEVWVYFPWTYWNGNYTISGRWSNWSNNITNQTAAPATGTLQSIEYRADGQTANSKAQGIADNIYTAGTTTINGGKITTGSIAADKIKVDSLQAICAKIGGFDIDSNSIKSGTWGTDNSVLMCTGTTSTKSIGGSGTISGWCFTAGSTFGVTKAGALYANNVKVSGDITATSGTIGKLVINGNYLQADSGTSGNVYRMYIQKPTSSTTWCFSTQYGDINSSKVGNFYARADGLVYCTSLTSNGAVSAGGNITTNGSITAAGKLTATGNFELRTSGNASNIILHDDYAKYCYIRYSGARLWFLPATDSGGFELGHSASLDANTGTFYATAWGSNSSRRYKENITELTESVADRLLKIKTYHFDYKKDYGSKDMYGVIAEEVEQVHKNAVLYRNGEPDAVDYTRFIPLLIKKVQMQDKKLKNLDNMVTHLIGIAMHPEKIDYNNN